MIKMGVKKKPETFEEKTLNEPAKSNRIMPPEWLHYRNQSARNNMQSTQPVNGESNYLNKQVELVEISHGINTTNKNYNNYLSVYDRENMSSAGESKSKQTQRSTRTYQNQVERNSNVVQQTIIISDEEDDDDDDGDEDFQRSHNAHNQEFDDDGKYARIAHKTKQNYQ